MKTKTTLVPFVPTPAISYTSDTQYLASKDSISKRKEYSNAQNVALVTQVSRVCPLCDESLFYKKGNKSYKTYEIAHIYPLYPTAEEVKLLKDEERLSINVNDENNVIPLCKSCHGKLDKPRTVEEYRNLLLIKKRLISRSGQEAIWKQYHIESEITEIVEALYKDFDDAPAGELNLDPKDILHKTNDSISKPTVRKIRNNVRDYYLLIRNKMASVDKSKMDFSTIVSNQIRTYYLKQKQMGLDQQAIFDNIVMWIHVKTKPKSNDAAEILASFFVQNCEVFE